MALGDIAAQLVHAAGETAEPLPISGTHAVVLSVENEEQLFLASEKLLRRNIPHKIIFEPDLPFNGAATAIGVYPVQNREQVKRALSRFPLLTKEKCYE